MSSCSSDKGLEDSDEEDVFEIDVLDPAEYSSDYNACFLVRWQRAIAEMGKLLRRDVLLPLQPGACIVL